MAPETLPAAAELQSEDAVDRQANFQMIVAAKSAENLGELRNNVREQINDLGKPRTNRSPMPAPKGGDGASLQDASPVPTETLRQRLRQKEVDLKKATQGYEQVGLADYGGGLQGTNVMGGDQSSAKVARNLVIDTDTLHGTAIHEADEEVGHPSHAVEFTPFRQDVALIAGQYKNSVVDVFEGYVERGVAIKRGLGAESHREGQPQDVYAHGQNSANYIVTMIGQEEYDKVLKRDGEEAGNLGYLQQQIWTVQLETGRDVQEIIEEAKETGYVDNAREAILEVGKEEVDPRKAAQQELAMAA